MAMGRQGDRQGDLMVMWSEMPRSPGHVFYDRLQQVLVDAGFDGFVETLRALQHQGRTLGAAGGTSACTWSGTSRGGLPERAAVPKIYERWSCGEAGRDHSGSSRGHLGAEHDIVAERVERLLDRTLWI